ncbi:radical SAM protein [candidate division CSSED10-310 bacterium]|uniref:Radical SAM protein n=1 Tax=candidate division CSSED10-310 bacterium TaxID=2855610 RepID=A0ABV6YTM1_UNCC1
MLGIISRKWVFGGPRLVALIISKTCNSRCVMCWYHSPLFGEKTARNQDLDPATFMDYNLCEDIIRELQMMGTLRVVLGGHGEPTLHPQFERILDLLLDLRMNPYVISNGLTLNVHRAKLWASKGAYFRFSIHAGDVETWLKIHPECSTSQFEEISRCIQVIAASNSAKVALMHAIQRPNFRHIPQMIEHARTLGVRELLFFPVRTDRTLHQIALLPDEEKELASELQTCQQRAEKYEIRTNLLQFLANNHLIRAGQLHTAQLYQNIPCYIGWLYSEFDIDGQMRSCENSDVDMGYAGQQSIGEIWHSPRYRSFRQEALMMPQRRTFIPGCVCKSCPMFQFNINVHNLFHFKKIRETVSLLDY